MARRGWLIGIALSLAACSGSGGGADSTLTPPVAESTSPPGFGGTLPVPYTTAVETLSAPAQSAAPTTSVSTTDEAALRSRVLAYDRAFREELLHMPHPDYRPVIERIERQQDSAVAALCAEDNIVALNPGPDGRAHTEDDTIAGGALSATRHVEQWVVNNGQWQIASTVSYEDLGKGGLCKG